MMEESVLTKEEFGRNLRILMAWDNTPVKALADHLGVTAATVTLWRSGKHKPSEAVVKKAIEFFNNTLIDVAHVIAKLDTSHGAENNEQ